jgi:hypothetical protein
MGNRVYIGQLGRIEYPGWGADVVVDIAENEIGALFELHHLNAVGDANVLYALPAGST